MSFFFVSFKNIKNELDFRQIKTHQIKFFLQIKTRVIISLETIDKNRINYELRIKFRKTLKIFQSKIILFIFNKFDL